MGVFFRKEINQVSDLSGLKFRIGGLGGTVLSRLGVVPQQIAPGDVYPALERGTLDAAEFVGPYDDEKLGFLKVAKYYYAPGWWEGGAMLHLVVNQQKWNELPKAYQAILSQASEAANSWMLAKYDAVNGQALRRMVAAGADLRTFSPAIMDASLKAANEVYADLSAKNADFKKAYESIVAYRNDVLPWWQLNEYAFDTFMIRTKGRS
jgi:TRAP-type mannitol/chloroaromatic compound transport system substrate-binding protein